MSDQWEMMYKAACDASALDDGESTVPCDSRDIMTLVERVRKLEMGQGDLAIQLANAINDERYRARERTAELEQERDSLRSIVAGVQLKWEQKLRDARRQCERDIEIRTLVEQLAEMNGGAFWSHLGRLPVSKFVGPLREVLGIAEDP